jgi:hypothetical protein
MPSLLLLSTLLWLVPLALYDLRHRAVLHIAFVAVPCLLAVGFAALRGDWPLAAMAAVGVAVSERHHLPATFRKWVFWAGLLAAMGLIPFASPEVLPGAFAVLGFWLSFEIGWWAGADALAAITLALLWPDVLLLVALAVAHLGLSLIARRPIRLPRTLTPSELDALGQPGLPALALSVLIYAVLQFVPALS